MASRVDFYFRQRVTEAELDLAFELLEQADHDLASDIGLFGIVTGAVPAPHAPVADLTIDLTAPARAYDRLGQRIAYGTGQRVDLSLDHTGIPTEVRTSTNERWLGVFLKFDRLLSEPRTDGHSSRVFFRRDESFALVVRQAPEGAIGSAPRVPLEDDELLVCDVRRRAGATQIAATDIDLTRRQAFVLAEATAVGVVAALWSVLPRDATTTQGALDAIDRVLAAHGAGTLLRHRSVDVDHAPRAPLTATTVGAAIGELTDKLASRADGAAGSTLVGADGVPGTPLAMAAGSVDAQLGQLLGFLNAHLAARSEAHPAAAISLLDSGGAFTGTNAAAILLELISAFNADHYRGNESSPGQHKTIHQPVLGSGRVLLWDARGTGAAAARARFYLDGTSLWITLNARWDGTQWVRDTADHCGGLRLSKDDFELMQYAGTTPAAFTTWQKRWTLSMNGIVNTAFETTALVAETGHVSLESTNTSAAAASIAMGCAVTFRTRLPAAPSSVTFSSLVTSPGWTGTPTVYRSTRDGLNIYAFSLTDPGRAAWWHGTFLAVA